MQLAVATLRPRHSNKPGFTLVELLVVISIISVLAGLILVNVAGVRERAADARRKSDLRQFKTALQLYHNDFQSYPIGDGGLDGCGDGGVNACGTEFSARINVGANTSIYMKELPQEYFYYSDGGETYILQVDLQNLSDADIAASQTKCDPSSRAYYDGVGTLDPDTSYFVCED